MSETLQSSVKTLSINTTRYDRTPGILSADLLTLPLHTQEGNPVLMQVLRHTVDVKSPQDRPQWIIATMSGGGAGAM